MAARGATQGSDGPRHHVVIAGTGRAGTTFLVEFLRACGLDVGTSAQREKRAQAGLEHSLLDPSAPHIVKDPWLFTYCDEIDPDQVVVDALIVPIRDLMASANSRVLQERAALVETEWRARPTVDVWGGVRGGVVYSLDPVDQARLLAVGFHRLLHWAVEREIPLFPLHFPRLVDDGEYLIDSLWPWLGTQCSKEAARTAFALTADPEAVRFRDRLEPDVGLPGAREPDQAARLDRAALAMLLDEREEELVAVKAELDRTREELADVRRHLAERESQFQDQLQDAQQAIATTTARLEDTAARLEDTEAQLVRATERLEEAERELQSNQLERDALHGTLSWRMTRPLRAARSHFVHRQR